MSSSANELLERAVEGDPGALSQLLERHGPTLRGSLAGQIPQRWQAVLSVDDVVQQTYVDAFLDVKHFEPRGEDSFVAWLVTLAKRNLVDALRMLEAQKRGQNRRPFQPRSGEKSLLALYEKFGCTRSTPSGHVARDEALHCLRQAIEQLPPIYRRVVELYDLQGRSVEEVAAALQRSPGAAFMLRARAHRRLYEIMGTASLYMSGTT